VPVHRSQARSATDTDPMAPKPLRSRGPADGPVAPAAGPPPADTNPVVTTISEPPSRAVDHTGSAVDHQPPLNGPMAAAAPISHLPHPVVEDPTVATSPELRPSCADHDPAVREAPHANADGRGEA